jgi:membrane-associated phospholipid phosphatase
MAIWASTATTAASARRWAPALQPGLTGPRGVARRLLIEALLFTAGVLAYFSVRGLTESSAAVAVAHARELVRVERWLGVFHEHDLQRVVLDHEWLTSAFSRFYIFGHWPLIIGCAVWLAWRRPDTYRWLRTAMLVSGLIGVVVFVTYPVAPPRLAGLGIVDTVVMHTDAYRVLQPPSFVNQYAAMPSLHVGWDLLVCLALFRAGVPRWVRRLAVLAPVLMAITVVATGNHYLVDVVAGVGIALIGAMVATSWARWADWARGAKRSDDRGRVSGRGTAGAGVGDVHGGGGDSGQPSRRVPGGHELGDGGLGGAALDVPRHLQPAALVDGRARQPQVVPEPLPEHDLCNA